MTLSRVELQASKFTGFERNNDYKTKCRYNCAATDGLERTVLKTLRMFLKCSSIKATNKTATAIRGSYDLSSIPLSRSDSKFIIKDIGRNLNRGFWNSANYHTEAPFQLGPEVKLKMPSNISRKQQSVIHRLRVGVEFTGQYLHRLGWNALSLCNKCKVVDDIFHALLTCTQYNTKKS